MHRGECVTTAGLYRPTHLCVAHLNCTKKSSQFFLWCGKVGGGVFGGVDHVSGGRGFHGVSEWGGSHSLGEKAVEQSGGAGSDAPVPSF